MALTAQQVQQFYIGYYGRPADPVGLTFWQTQTEAQALTGFAGSAEFTNQFTGLSTSQQVTKVYGNLLGRAPDVAGLLYWSGEITAGRQTIGSLVLSMIKNALGKDVTTIQDRVTYSTAFTTALNTTEEVNAYSGATATQTARDALLKVIATAVGDHTALTTETAKIDATIATIVAGGGSSSGQTFTLTSGADQADTSGSSKNGGLITSDFKFTSANETVTAVAGTLAAGDVLADGSTTDADVLNATITAAGATVVSITNIETINADVKIAAGGLNMASITGAKVVSVNTNTGIAAQVINIAPATAPAIELKGSGVLTANFTTFAGTTAAGTAESASFKLNGATVSGANVAGLTLTATAAGTLETLNLESAGSVKNTVALTSANAIGKAVVTGAADLELRAAAGTLSGVELNGSAHTGVLTVRADFDSGAANSLVGLNAEKFSGVDAYVVTDTDGLGASAEAFGLYNIATGSSVRIADDFLGIPASLITVAGATAGTAESVSVDLNTRATTATDVDLTGLTINGVETITINSVGAATSGAAIQNSITTLLADKVQTLTLKGSSELLIGGLAAAASNSSNITVDASTLTGKLSFTTGVIADTTATGRALAVKGGTVDDILDASAAADGVKTTYTGGTGKDTFVVKAAASATTGLNDAIADLTNGDIVKLAAVGSATAGTFVNGLDSVNEITAAEQTTIEAAADVAAAAIIALEASTQAGATANKAMLFSYQGNQYIFLNEVDAVANTASYEAGDAIIKVTGLSSTTTFDAGTFLFAA